MNREESSQPVATPRTGPVENSSSDFDESKKLIDSTKRKIPTIIMTSYSDGCLSEGKPKLSVEEYNQVASDEDSLNFNSIHAERIML